MYFDHILFFLPLSLDPPHFPSVLNLVLFLSQGKKRKSAKQNGSHTHTKKKKHGVCSALATAPEHVGCP